MEAPEVKSLRSAQELMMDLWLAIEARPSMCTCWAPVRPAPYLQGSIGSFFFLVESQISSLQIKSFRLQISKAAVFSSVFEMFLRVYFKRPSLWTECSELLFHFVSVFCSWLWFLKGFYFFSISSHHLLTVWMGFAVFSLLSSTEMDEKNLR